MTFGERVKQWASDRNLIEGSKPMLQTKKLREEFNEALDALVDIEVMGGTEETVHELKDGIGDTCVVFAVICAQLGIEFEECLEIAWDAIKNRKGKMIDGVFVKEAE